MKVGILEGLLFVVGEDGLTKEKIEEILEVEDATSILEELKKELEDEKRGLQLVFLGNRYKLTTKKGHKSYYETLAVVNDVTLSQAALETLAIIAYNMPITRVTVDEVRGVSSSHMIRKLISRNLVKEMGRSDLPGRPLLYGVTDEFLDHFGLSSMEDLPKIEEVKPKEEEDIYQTRYKDE